MRLHSENLLQFTTNFLWKPWSLHWKTFKREKNFEVNMYTTEMKKAIPSTSWFYILYVHPENEIDSILPSRLQIVLILDSGAFILVLNIQHTWCSLRCSMFVIMINMLHQKLWLLQLNLKFQSNIYFYNLSLINWNKIKFFLDSFRWSWA